MKTGVGNCTPVLGYKLIVDTRTTTCSVLFFSSSGRVAVIVLGSVGDHPRGIPAVPRYVIRPCVVACPLD